MFCFLILQESVFSKMRLYLIRWLERIEPETPKILSEYLAVIKSELYKCIKIIYRLAMRMAVKLKSNGTSNAP